MSEYGGVIVSLVKMQRKLTERGCVCQVGRWANPGTCVQHGEHRYIYSSNFLFPDFLECLLHCSSWRIFPHFCYMNPLCFCAEWAALVHC